MAGLGCQLGHVPYPPYLPAGATVPFAFFGYAVGKEAVALAARNGDAETVAGSRRTRGEAADVVTA